MVQIYGCAVWYNNKGLHVFPRVSLLTRGKKSTYLFRTFRPFHLRTFVAISLINRAKTYDRFTSLAHHHKASTELSCYHCLLSTVCKILFWISGILDPLGVQSSWLQPFSYLYEYEQLTSYNRFKTTLLTWPIRSPLIV